jgi:hypothetical protein
MHVTDSSDESENMSDANNYTLPVWEHIGNGMIVGNPDRDTHDWVHQTTPFTCDVVSQEMILHEYGMDVSEAQLTYDAASHGWLTDNGTSPQDMARLLDLYGVDTHINYSGRIDDLAAELAQGHKVIVAVDSGDLWNSPDSNWFDRHVADHAIVITGLNMSNPDRPMVVVNDPGDPSGAGKEYPLGQFLEAWGGSRNMYVATDYAPSSLTEQPILGSNFHRDPSGAGGMYMNSAYWAAFLQGLGVVVAVDWLSNQNESRNPISRCETYRSPWEDMPPDQRNQIFTQI